LLRAALVLMSAPVHAIGDRADIEKNDPVSAQQPVAWKLTAGAYSESAARPALDINLRGNREVDTFWLGHYQRGSEFQQTRAGYERQWAMPLGRVIASAQGATRGFAGGSVTLEFNRASARSEQGEGTGQDSTLFVLLGLGRTNLRPYYNLNFDPNDSTLIGIGGRWHSGSEATLYQIHDNRLGTGQRVTHAVWRRRLGEGLRITLDLFQRDGRSDRDAERYRGTGISMTLDVANAQPWSQPWFVRLVHDPKANFTDIDMTRVALGLRF
jgi:hypothetical protein